QRPRRPRPPHGARRGFRDRRAAPPRDDGLGLGVPRLAVPPRPVHREDRRRARAAAVRRRAPRLLRGRPRRLVGDLAAAADPARSGRSVVSLVAAGALPAPGARGSELPAPQPWSWLCPG